ncbi:MAG TPA: hypothetical protein VGP71_14465 [Burkholderiales bacterium]|jgi:hypothetical protein|nr:hypothetical protein [Burkholderiales bacterium]
MNRDAVRSASTLLLAATLGCGAAAVSAAEKGETKTLATQTSQMDSLATTKGAATVSGRISSDFGGFAGSTSNADALVGGLRNGTAITLSSTDAKGVTTSTTFTPPTGKMGHGNVYISLALAKQQLAGLGITDPTAQQIQAALVGGTVIGPTGQATALTGVLTLRAQGMGWGQIAHNLGYKLGPVISGMKSANAHVSTQSAASASSTHPGGVTTAAGSNPGQGNAFGRGITTGAGGAAGQGQGNAFGRGITSGAGGAPGQSGSAGQGKGAGKGG